MVEGLKNAAVATPLLERPFGTVACGKVVCLNGFDSNVLDYRNLTPLVQFDGRRDVQHTVDLLGWEFTEKLRTMGYDVSARRMHLTVLVRGGAGNAGGGVSKASLPRAGARAGASGRATVR